MRDDEGLRQPPQEPGGAPTPDGNFYHREHAREGRDNLSGRAALITGADRGIGRAVAIAFADAGADVLIGYRCRHAVAQELARRIEQAGRRAVLLAGDIADPGYCRALVDRTCREFGRLDILVNNPAFGGADAAGWDREFQLNIDSMFYLCMAAARCMPAGGMIINTTLVNLRPGSGKSRPATRSRGAVAMFTAALAGLLADTGIRVNCLAPGPTCTPLATPQRRRSAALAAAYLRLASGGEGELTGALIPLTGGGAM